MNKQITIKDLPEENRPYERCILFGPSSLSDAELLAVILKNGTSGSTAIDVANDLLSKSKNGLIGLTNLHMEELKSVGGIGTIKAVQIRCLCELSKRMAKVGSKQKICFDHPEAIVQYYGPELRYKEYENLIMLALNTKSMLIDEFLISKGTVNSSIASPREIFLEALKAKAVSIVLIHNHPSGDSTPSREDITITRRIKEAGELLGIYLIDHIIIGDNNYTSFKEKRLL